MPPPHYSWVYQQQRASWIGKGCQKEFQWGMQWVSLWPMTTEWETEEGVKVHVGDAVGLGLELGLGQGLGVGWQPRSNAGGGAPLYQRRKGRGSPIGMQALPK